jgi:hypothetical protein
MNNKTLLKSRDISDFEIWKVEASPQYLVVGSLGPKV